MSKGGNENDIRRQDDWIQNGVGTLCKPRGKPEAKQDTYGSKPYPRLFGIVKRLAKPDAKSTKSECEEQENLSKKKNKANKLLTALDPTTKIRCKVV